MPIKINEEKKEVFISVSELAAEEESQSKMSLAASRSRLSAGRKVHQAYQQRQEAQIENYRREVTINFKKQLGAYTFIVQGRLDGIYETDGKTVVEEVKSVILPPAQFDKIEAHRFPSYLNQIRTYCYFIEEMGYSNVRGVLVFVNIADQTELRKPVSYQHAEAALFVEQRLQAIFSRIQAQNQRNAERLKMSRLLKFPHPAVREFQDEVMQDIEQTLSNSNDILISAPAGIGKTAAALFPTLKFALEKRKYIFYVTSKTTQQMIVQQAVDLMNRQEGVCIRAITIQAKEKICPQDEQICHEEFCPYIQKYTAKLESGTFFQELLALGNILPDQVLSAALAHQVCPFELSLDLSLMVDLIIGDYNYVFDPSVSLKRFFKAPQQSENYLLIIDEAHNLYARGREYYSPGLPREAVQAQLYECQKYTAPVFEAIAQVVRQIDTVFQDLEFMFPNQGRQSGKAIFEPDKSLFKQIQETLSEIMLDYYIYKKLNFFISADDPFDEFFYRFSKFESVLSLDGEEFIYLFDCSPEKSGIQIICLDPANRLRKRLDGLYSTIAMSATFEPLHFYRDVLGFGGSVETRSYPSPFPVENRKILIAPRISTRYQHRQRAYAPIAEIIQQVVMLQPGNYFAFFPSFHFLNQVAEHIYLSDVNIIRQQSFMRERDRQNVLDQLKQADENNLVLAVQGGIFAEGVDYPGKMVIGAFIIGPALPAYTFEQELLKQYYQEHYGAGFEYAYLYPGINRVIQAAGRVIRTHSDRGIILLIGQRFATEFYNSQLPAHWYDASPFELVSEDLIADITEFW